MTEKLTNKLVISKKIVANKEKKTTTYIEEYYGEYESSDYVYPDLSLEQIKSLNYYAPGIVEELKYHPKQTRKEKKVSTIKCSPDDTYNPLDGIILSYVMNIIFGSKTKFNRFCGTNDPIKFATNYVKEKFSSVDKFKKLVEAGEVANVKIDIIPKTVEK